MEDEEKEEKKFVGTIHLCCHCSTPTNGKYCNDCKTVEQRKNQCMENDKLRMERFGKHYICPLDCLKLKVN